MLKICSLEGGAYWHHLLFIYTRVYILINNTMDK